MSARPATRAHWIAATFVLLAPLACGDGIVLDPGGPPDVAGSYAIDFTIDTTIETIFGFEGCADLIEVGSTAATLEITQEDDIVTLGLAGLGLPIRSDLTAQVTPDGAFFFEGSVVAGPVRIPNEPMPVDVAGNATVEGTIDERTGALDLQFDVGAVTCAFQGTIVGQRS